MSPLEKEEASLKKADATAKKIPDIIIIQEFTPYFNAVLKIFDFELFLAKDLEKRNKKSPPKKTF
jgi:hypothetical protein